MNISFSMTTDQILARTKRVTRRMGWLKIRDGQILQPVYKAQGLKKGEKIRLLGGPIRVVIPRREPLNAILALPPAELKKEIELEGFLGMPAEVFIQMFCLSHKKCTPDTVITRIEFDYV